MTTRTRKQKASKAWAVEHVNDPYVQQAKAGGWRSRAIFKLKEIDEKDRLLKPGMTVVDLGAAPGSWSQYVVKRVQPGGRVLAIDLLPIEPIPGVEIIRGDFREDEVLRQMEHLLGNQPVDLVLSDMAPNISGVGVSDQARAAHLIELALEFAQRHLKPGGNMLVKAFQGTGYDALRKAITQTFEVVSTRKPSASRDRSAEMFLLGRNKRSQLVCSPGKTALE